MLLLWTSPLHFNPLIYFSKSSQSVQLSSPTDSKAVKSLRSLQVATHSCPTFCRTSSTSSTGSAISNDLNSFELLAAQLPLQRPSNRFPGLPMSTGLFTAHVRIPNCFQNPIGKSWNKLLRQVLYHRQLLKHCKAGAFVSWKRATFWQPTSCLQTFTNKLRIRKDPFQNKYDYSIYPICFQILMRYGIGPGAPLLAVLHPAMSSSSAR